MKKNTEILIVIGSIFLLIGIIFGIKNKIFDNTIGITSIGNSITYQGNKTYLIKNASKGKIRLKIKTDEKGIYAINFVNLPSTLELYYDKEYTQKVKTIYRIYEEAKEETIIIYYKNNGETYKGNISVNAVKSERIGSMKNKADTKEDFWSDEYRPYIENIEFIIDGNFECKELCFDISEGINKVYAKLIKKEETYTLQIISAIQIYLPDDSSKLFSNFPKLKNINFKNTNTEYVIDMSYMFAENTNIENLDLSSFNVKKVETMEGMFKNCENLKTIDLSSFTFNETLKYNLIFKNINPSSIIYVKSSIEQAWIFGLNIYIRPGTWTIKNIIVK